MVTFTGSIPMQKLYVGVSTWTLTGQWLLGLGKLRCVSLQGYSVKMFCQGGQQQKIPLSLILCGCWLDGLIVFVQPPGWVAAIAKGGGCVAVHVWPLAGQEASRQQLNEKTGLWLQLLAHWLPPSCVIERIAK
jgi:hypothetical protein